MNIKLENLPEKDYFSFEEIAERWSCDLETIYHYIYEKKILHPGLSTKKNGIYFAISLDNENYPEYKKIHDIVCGLDKWEGETNFPRRIDITPKKNDEYVQEIFDSLNQGLLEQNRISGKKLPSFLYQLPSELVGIPLIDNDKLMMEGKDTYGCYISARDITDKRYFFFAWRRSPCVYPITPTMFNLIPKEERDRFEKEYGIIEKTEDVQKRVSAKTEHKYLELIQVFVDILLKDGLTEEPYGDAKKIEYLISNKGKKMPCSVETLGNYLKNRL